MDIILTEIIFFSFITFFLTCVVHMYFVNKSHNIIPFFTHVSAIISLYICLMPFPLLTIDINSSVYMTEHDQQIPSTNLIYNYWHIIFVVTQLMSWIVLPILQSYDVSGELTTFKKMQYALKDNIKSYLIYGFFTAIALVYIVIIKKINSISEIVVMCISISNTIGIVILIPYLSYGLVKFPQKIIEKSNFNIFCFKMSYVYDIIIITKMELDENLYDIRNFRSTGLKCNIVLSDLIDQITCINDEIKLTYGSFAKNNLNEQPIIKNPLNNLFDYLLEKTYDESHYPSNCDESYLLIKLRMDTKKNLKILCQHVFKYNEMNIKYNKYTNAKNITIANQTIAKQPTVQPTVQPTQTDDRDNENNNSEYVIKQVIMDDSDENANIFKPNKLLIACGYFLYLFTFVILLEETLVPIQFIYKFSILDPLIENDYTRLLTIIVFLSYMSTCTYWAFYQIKIPYISSNFIMPSVSDASSMCFSLGLLTRLVLPLCYNFIWIADVRNNEQFAYIQFFGHMDIIDFFGKQVNLFVSLFIPLFAIFHYFDLFKKILKINIVKEQKRPIEDMPQTTVLKPTDVNYNV